jgi:hypothetical protein
MAFGFISDIVKASGKGIRAVSGGIAHAGGALGHLSGKLPVIGKPLQAVFAAQFGVFMVVDDVLAGGRIDKVVFKQLKRDIKAAKAVAPYAQAAVSLIPGIGTGAAGVIGGAAALAEGKSIDAALIAGVRGAVPGGPAGQALFDVGCAVMQGKGASEAALKAIPLPEEQKKLAIAGMQAISDVAHGKKIDEAIIARGMAALPDNIRKGAQIGMTMAHAKNLQEATRIGVKQGVKALESHAAKAVQTDARFKAGLTLMPAKAKKGYLVGIGLLSHQVTPVAIKAARDSLPKESQAGFDTAVAARIGSTKPLHLRGTAAQQFVIMAGVGARKGSAELKQGIRQTLAQTDKRMVELFDTRATPLWKRVLVGLHLIKGNHSPRIRIKGKVAISGG